LDFCKKRTQREREKDANLCCNTKVVGGSEGDFVVTDDYHIPLNFFTDALGGTAAHFELHSVHPMPGLQTQQRKKNCTQQELRIHDHYGKAQKTTTI
jgi:hypothetical protein